ncbi:MAG: hypothetical protein JXR19_02415 [Bacteroidia bacterium]
MKYKRLSIEELEELREEFVNFLVVVGITADEWSVLLKEEKDKASDIIDQFSDVVWEGVLRKAKYLHRITERSIYAFHCEADRIHLIRLTDCKSNADFNDESYLAKRLRNPSGLRVAKKTKGYTKNREDEIYDLISTGCIISDGLLYRSLDRD